MSRYRFIQGEQAAYPITLLYRVLDVARAAYDAWARRGVSARAQADADLAAPIAAAHARSRGTSGTPRVHAALRAAGVRTSRRRVARLLRAGSLVGCHRHRRARTTVTDPAPAPALNLVARDFAVPAPDRPWLGDSTYVPTGEGRLSLAVLLDAHSRRVIGWAMADHLRTELALDALALALCARRPGANLVHHTDRGCQYTAAAYREALAARGLTASLRRSGESLDNAMAARFFATRKAELVDRHHWATCAAARMAIFAWIAVFHNRQRAHSALAYRPAATFEAAMLLLHCPAA